MPKGHYIWHTRFLLCTNISMGCAKLYLSSLLRPVPITFFSIFQKRGNTTKQTKKNNNRKRLFILILGTWWHHTLRYVRAQVLTFLLVLTRSCWLIHTFTQRAWESAPIHTPGTEKQQLKKHIMGSLRHTYIQYTARGIRGASLTYGKAEWQSRGYVIEA